MLIYKAVNKINGKEYVGLTTQTLKNRIYGHVRDAKRHPDIKFYRAINKYGIDNFEFSIIEDGIEDIETLKSREVYWIKMLGTYEKGYNSTHGGDDSPMWHPEARLKISIANKGKIVSATTRQKLRVATSSRPGTPHTEKHKQYMSEIMTGKVFTPEHLENMSKSQMGKTQSPETIEKRVKHIRGVKKTPEHRAKLIANLGKAKKLSGTDHPRSIAVNQFDIETGEIIHSFDTIGDAEESMNVRRGTGQISRCINGKQKTAYGYVWETQYWLPQHLNEANAS